ncbi:MAG TPA: SDR family oxidoreductase [Candidatus Deferrimicrobium sp.]|nr:SDR family oxidoreductase [Candidatus Deferrimicrobium sp.]
MMNDEKKIVITGASSEIGLAIFNELFHSNPHAYFILQGTANTAALKPVFQQHPGVCEIQKVDFNDEKALSVFLQGIRDSDILVNAAAVTVTGTLPQLELEMIRRMVCVNIEALTRLCAAVLPGMVAKRHGCIVNISSVTASRGNRGQSVYAGTKGYVESFTRSLAAEYGARGIRVNGVAPGPINSGKLTELLEYAPDEVKKSIAANRLGEPADVANLVGFLCSEKAAFINGKIIGVDGGFMRGV